MNKFENVDIFASLDAIMRQNTGFFQSDFDIDKQRTNNMEEKIVRKPKHDLGYVTVSKGECGLQDT